MHGIVNRGLQLFLIEEYGEDFWRELAVSLDQESGFEALLLYDDEVTRGLMSARPTFELHTSATFELHRRDLGGVRRFFDPL